MGHFIPKTPNFSVSRDNQVSKVEVPKNVGLSFSGQYGTVPVSMGLSVTAIGFLIDVPTI